MTPILFGLIAAAAVVVYWAFCRRSSLKHRAKAVQLIEAYFQDEANSAADKESIYLAYLTARHWVFLPIMMLFTPFVMLVMIFFTDGDLAPPRLHSDSYDEVMESLLKMYMTRNPITATACLAVIATSVVMVLPLGLLLNRIKSIPSLIGIFGSVVSRATKSKLAHAH